MSVKSEVGNTYGSWTVVERAETRVSAAAWLCQCQCGNTRPILGTELRRGKAPLCANCCRKCGQARGNVMFIGNRRTCIKCERQQVKEWKEANKSRNKEAIDNWIKKNPEKVRQYREGQRNRTQSSPQNFIAAAYRDKCRKAKRAARNLDGRSQQRINNLNKHIITITLDQTLNLWDKQGGRCAISDMPMTYEFNNPRTISLDRVDSNAGYTPINTQLVCKWVNLAKNNLPDDEIRAILREFKES